MLRRKHESYFGTRNSAWMSQTSEKRAKRECQDQFLEKENDAKTGVPKKGIKRL